MSLFLSGILSGIISVYVPIYRKAKSVAEITPHDYKGRPGAVNQTFITLGIFIESCMELFSEQQGFAFYLCLLPNLFPLAAVIGMWSYAKFESPVYLWVTDQRHAAMRVMKRLANEYQGSFTVKPSQALSERETSHIAADNEISIELMNNPVVRKILFLTMALSMMQQFTGINNVLVFSVKSFSQ
jgi:hypothetical protein